MSLAHKARFELSTQALNELAVYQSSEEIQGDSSYLIIDIDNRRPKIFFGRLRERDRLVEVKNPWNQLIDYFPEGEAAIGLTPEAQSWPWPENEPVLIGFDREEHSWIIQTSLRPTEESVRGL